MRRGDVGVADAHAAHPDEDLALARRGHLHVLNLERSADLAEQRCPRRRRAVVSRRRRVGAWLGDSHLFVSSLSLAWHLRDGSAVLLGDELLVHREQGPGEWDKLEDLVDRTL